MMLADAVDSGRLVATFLELVALDSPTGHEEKIGRELSARFSELGCQLSQDEVDNLIAVCRAPWPTRCSCRLTWTRSAQTLVFNPSSPRGYPHRRIDDSRGR